MNTRVSSENDVWRLPVRRLVTAGLVFHLLAVVVPPLQLATTSSPVMRSPFMDQVGWVFQPYDDALFLNHGYAFFAPNPGSNFLLYAVLEFTDGRQPIIVRLPDTDQRFPRLMYHRYFMLSEHFNGAYPGYEEPVDAPAELVVGWKRSRQIFKQREASMIRHLTEKYGASRVTLERWEHRPPSTIEMFQGRIPIDAPELYRRVDSDRGNERAKSGRGQGEVNGG
ncbi:MAG: hypothetical protein ABGX22_14565 [Pirellulaceae bacterium]